MKKSFSVGLISPYSNVSAIGLRQISACLKEAGWATRLIFLPDPAELLYLPQPHPPTYPPAVLEQVCQLCADLDLVGIGVMSNFVGRARALTQALHQRSATPVVWGGIHPTVRPEECLAWADYVCLGEGEGATLDLVARLAAGGDGHAVPNIWSRNSQDGVVTNPPRPLHPRLDDLPLPDYDLGTQYLLHQGRIVPLTPELLAHYMLNPFQGRPQVAYMTCVTRGCPYRCTYCCADAYARLYPDWRRVRRRSPEHVVAEIEAARQLIPGLRAIMFLDDAFLATSTQEIRRFSQVYRERVGLPFFILASPPSVTEEKLDLLVQAGLQDVEMGIQSGSPRTRRLYQRPEKDSHVLQAADCIHRFRDHIPQPIYDLITDNPYETLADRLATLRLLDQLPRPYSLHVHSLDLYPGTELYRQARADRLIQDDERDVYRKNVVDLAPTYYNLVLRLMNRHPPRWLLGLMIRPLTLRLLESRLMRGPLRLLWAWFNARRARRMRRWHARQKPTPLPSKEEVTA